VNKTTLLLSLYQYLILQEEEKEVSAAVEKGEIETIDKFIKKYGINNIRLFVSK